MSKSKTTKTGSNLDASPNCVREACNLRSELFDHKQREREILDARSKLINTVTREAGDSLSVLAFEQRERLLNTLETLTLLRVPVDVLFSYLRERFPSQD